MKKINIIMIFVMFLLTLQGVNASITNTSLVVWLPMNETSGTIAQDYAGGDNNATTVAGTCSPSLSGRYNDGGCYMSLATGGSSFDLSSATSWSMSIIANYNGGVGWVFSGTGTLTFDPILWIYIANPNDYASTTGSLWNLWSQNGFAPTTGTEICYTTVFNGINYTWYDGTGVARNTVISSTKMLNWPSPYFFKAQNGNGWTGTIRQYVLFKNRVLTDSERADWCTNHTFMMVSPVLPIIASANCTSSGDATSPYTTADTTPTFRFDTNGSANCRIASSLMNYATMSSSRNCTSGEGTNNHICTLTSQDELTLSTSYVYLACVNSANNSLESNATLQLDITNLAQNASLQIQQGIQASVIWPNAVVYTNQKVYLRNLANSQLLTTVTNVVVSGNQRWLINYGNTSIGLFNLTPVVYSLELVNAPIEQIPRMVASFINSTKR